VEAEVVMSEKPITIIKPKNNLLELQLGEVWKYRDLMWMFVKRNFITFYKQTIFGPLWFLLHPIFSSAAYFLIFGKLAKIPTDEIPQMLFYMAGVINWSYFTECFNKTSGIFSSNQGLFGKIYFPRLVVPISDSITSMIRYLIQFAMFLVFYLVFFINGFPIKISWLAIFTPFIIIYLTLVALGFGMWISSLTTKYWDLRIALGFGVQLWMYATPIVYPLSLVPEKYRIFMMLNPVTPAMEFFKLAWLGAGTVDLFFTSLSILVTIIVVFTGLIIFNKIEKTFMDII